MTSPFLSVQQVADRYARPSSWVYELACNGLIPHFKHAGGRHLYFKPNDLDAWDEGAELSKRDLPRGGRVVKPI